MRDNSKVSIDPPLRSRATRRRVEPQLHERASLILETGNVDDEAINEDDLCPICQLLLCNPVTTQCRHTLCKSCMETWADVSVTLSTKIVRVDEEASAFDAATGLEARCPMCRAQTSASLDEKRTQALRLKYERAYAEREAEEAQDDEAGEGIQTITVMIGNRHEHVEPLEGEDTANRHLWTFFVKPDRTDIIEEVQMGLHPSFRPNRLIRTRPPFAIQRLGWGTFTITAGILLKAGYSWMSSDAEDSPDGAPKGMLRLEWTLDFTSFGGTGAMGRCRLKVKNDRGWHSKDLEADRREWERTMRQYERDGRYEPD